MQAIRTKFFGPSNSRGARMQAKAEAKTVFIPWNYNVGVEENHVMACEYLCHVLGWNSDHYANMVGGQFGDAHYWVFTNSDSPRTRFIKR